MAAEKMRSLASLLFQLLEGLREDMSPFGRRVIAVFFFSAVLMPALSEMFIWLGVALDQFEKADLDEDLHWRISVFAQCIAGIVGMAFFMGRQGKVRIVDQLLAVMAGSKMARALLALGIVLAVVLQSLAVVKVPFAWAVLLLVWFVPFPVAASE